MTPFYQQTPDVILMNFEGSNCLHTAATSYTTVNDIKLGNAQTQTHQSHVKYKTIISESFTTQLAQHRTPDTAAAAAEHRIVVFLVQPAVSPGLERCMCCCLVAFDVRRVNACCARTFARVVRCSLPRRTVFKIIHHLFISPVPFLICGACIVCFVHAPRSSRGWCFKRNISSLCFNATGSLAHSCGFFRTVSAFLIIRNCTPKKPGRQSRVSAKVLCRVKYIPCGSACIATYRVEPRRMCTSVRIFCVCV